MPREEWADSAAPTALWSATLSSRQRVLLHAQPILGMRQNWSARDGGESAYDPLCLSMKLFEVVIDQSGFGNEVVRQTVTDALCPLLAALDRAASVTPDGDRHRQVVDRLLDGLMNETRHGHSFTVDYSEFDEAGRAHRRTFAFKLLKEVHGYSGEIALQLSSEAINLFLNALDLDIESEQIANEAVVEYQMARGKYDKARASAENARGQSLRYEEKIQRIIAQTKRDIRQVKWREDVHEILVEALEHIGLRLKTEDGIIRSATEKLDTLDDTNEKREAIASVVRLIKECRFRHLNLNKLLMSARGEFLDQQARQCFHDLSVLEVVNLRDDVLSPLLGFRSDQVCVFSQEATHTLLGPRVPTVLSLTDLIRWQLQPKRPVNLGEVPAEEAELVETNADLHRFDEEVLRDTGKVFAELNGRIQLSALLNRLNGDGCPVVIQDAVILHVLDYFDPDDERETNLLRVDLAVANGLATGRCHGDDLWIEPIENHL
jgi:tetratricopeptide (TPR) repeat protein